MNSCSSNISNFTLLVTFADLGCRNIDVWVGAGTSGDTTRKCSEGLCGRQRMLPLNWDTASVCGCGRVANP